jgi:hypothetical protein
LLFLHVDRLTRIDNSGGLGNYALINIPNLLAHETDYSRLDTQQFLREWKDIQAHFMS